MPLVCSVWKADDFIKVCYTSWWLAAPLNFFLYEGSSKPVTPVTSLMLFQGRGTAAKAPLINTMATLSPSPLFLSDVPFGLGFDFKLLQLTVTSKRR